MQYDAYKNNLTNLFRPVFFVIILLGLIMLVVTGFFPDIWKIALNTVGSSLLTIGITIPVALYFQNKSSAESFKILNTCNKVGIDSIFSSRKLDSRDLRAAIDAAVRNTTSMRMLGIAFKSFFDPSSESTDVTRQKINSPSTGIRVLLLNPDSDAATRRTLSEKGNALKSDIGQSIDNSLVAVIQERIKRYLRHEPKLKERITGEIRDNNKGLSDELTEEIKTAINLEVRIYDTEPSVFIMCFDNTLFTEQYHRGRPEEIVPLGSCIGKYMPVIQYRVRSIGYRFLECHFDAIWNQKETGDITSKLVNAAIERFGPEWLVNSDLKSNI